MKLITASRMREIDEAAARSGVSTLSLMMTAGEKTAILARRLMEEHALTEAVAVCGKGNNGGDGVAAVLHLHRLGVPARAILLFAPDGARGDAASVLSEARREGVALAVIKPPGGLRDRLAAPGLLLIDAVFGTGFRSPTRAPWSSVIDEINASAAPVLSLDLPSGLEADLGASQGSAVTARWTITLGAPKPALFIHPAARHAGAVIVADIGHPRELIDGSNTPGALLDAHWCRRALRPRLPDTHKGTYGHVLVVAGSRRMPGAAYLAALGAVRSGAGLVTLAAPGDVAARFHPSLPEIFPVSLPSDEFGAISRSAVDDLFSLGEGKDSLVIGPGLTMDEGVGDVVRRFLAVSRLPAVVDADALNVLAADPRALENRVFPTIITPHPGELSRLLATTTAAVIGNRAGLASEAAERFGALTVLKGAGTLVASPGGHYLVNVSGNAGMASGGTGDVLAGLIGGLLAQGSSPLEAAALGVYLHGLAGDLAAADIGPAGFTAHETADRIPAAAGLVLDGHDDIETI
jgi:hydroxyethylthiazole kinase-like uncharacterized protein yjeF